MIHLPTPSQISSFVKENAGDIATSGALGVAPDAMTTAYRTITTGQAPSGQPLYYTDNYGQRYTTAAEAAASNRDRASTIGAYDDAINQYNGQLGQLDGTQNIGIQNLQNAYNLQMNRLGEQRGIAERNYNDSTKANTGNYLSNRNSIMSNTRNTHNALQQLLGMNGAGNSSASYEAAPYAAALQGSQNLTQAQSTYGNNIRSLDNNWNDTQTSFKHANEDLDNQKYVQENGLKSSIAQTRATLLDKIREANINKGLAAGSSYATAKAGQSGLQSQISSLLGQITQLGSQYANPVLRAADVAYKAPELHDYSTGLRRAPIAGGGGGQSDLNPGLLNILAGQKQRDEYGNLIG